MVRYSIRFAIVLACSTAIGCGAEGNDNTQNDFALPSADAGGVDFAVAPLADAGPPDAIVCGEQPDPNPSWTQTLQKDVVATLAGEVEIEKGTKIPDRFLTYHRTLTRTYIMDQLSSWGLKSEVDIYATGANVFATMKSTQNRSETVVVGAHFDSWEGAPGANDNATGVALVLTAARYLSGVNCRKRNVIFAFFDEEEQKQKGSKHFAKGLFDAKQKIVAVHTVDQMGWDEDGDRAIELERPDPGFVSKYERAVKRGGFAIPLYTTDTGSTDHVSFRTYGFPAVGITEEYKAKDTTPYHHSAKDTFDTVNFDYLQSTTALLNTVLYDEVQGQ